MTPRASREVGAMFGLGFWEVVVIAVVAILFVGPEKLPNFFRALGRATHEFQRASRELRENLAIDEPPAPPPSRRPPPAARPARLGEPRWSPPATVAAVRGAPASLPDRSGVQPERIAEAAPDAAREPVAEPAAAEPIAEGSLAGASRPAPDERIAAEAPVDRAGLAAGPESDRGAGTGL